MHIYTLSLHDALPISDYVHVRTTEGLGSVHFTKGAAGNSYSNGIIRLAGTGSTIDGLIAHDPDDVTAHAIYVPGDENKVLNSIGYNGGRHKHKIPCFISGSNNLVEDGGFFGEGRYTLQIFKGRNNTVRRTIARWDSTVQGYLTEPNAAFSNYNSSGTMHENCVSLDYNSTPEPMKYGGDFYSPHNNYQWPEGNRDNGWYGCIVVYHDKGNDNGSNNNRAFMADTNSSAGNCVNNTIKDFYAKDSLRDFVINPQTEYNIEPGEDIDHIYIDGVKTNESVWPFKNEDIIKREMSKIEGGNRGWVASGKSLEDYIKG